MFKKLFVVLAVIMLLMAGVNAYAVTHNSSVNLDIAVNSDGYEIGGGTTLRSISITGTDFDITATTLVFGGYTYTLPGATGTLADLASVQTFTNKTLTSSTNTLGGVTMGMGSDAVGDTYYAGASNVLTRLAGNTTTTKKFLTQTGDGEASAAPSWGTVSSSDVGLGDVTNHAQVKRSEYTATGDILVGTGAGTLGAVTIGSTGQVLTVAGGTATWATPSVSLLPWTEVTGTSQSAAADNGYYTNNASLVTVTLPATCAAGKIIRIAGKGAGGWKIAQNADQLIHFGSVVTTTGTGGYLSSTNQYDTIELLCTVANTTFTVLSSQGNITYN